MPGTGGGEPGDLLLKVTVGTRPGYERKGSDVYTTISIPYYNSCIGGRGYCSYSLRKCDLQDP
ncbi:MAG: DnaJ C-terminal domain-containing protein [Ruminococcus sp.]